MPSGTLDNLPKDLKKEIEHLERLFTVDGAKLKEVTDHFVNELEKGRHLTEIRSYYMPRARRYADYFSLFLGLSVQGGSIVRFTNDIPTKT